MHGGKLSTKRGKKCIVRKPDDSAALAPCWEASEYVSMDVPYIPNEVEMAKMLKNPVRITQYIIYFCHLFYF